VVDRILGLYALVSTAAAVMLVQVCISMSPLDAAGFWILIALSTLVTINALVVWIALLLRARERRQISRTDVDTSSTR
jgi:cobalamin synthase